MKTPLIVVAMASLVLGIPSAFAAVPGINLGWSNCSTGSTTQNRSFACDANDRSFALVGSWILDQDMPDFGAVDAYIHVYVEGGIAPWFEWQPGGCREGDFTARFVGPVGGCTNPYTAQWQSQRSGPFELITPDRLQIRIAVGHATGVYLTANTLYTAFVAGLSTQGTVDEGAGVCAGCVAPACFVLGQLIVYGYGYGITLRSPHVRNWCSWQAETGSCPGATPNRTTTWGAVKAMYR